MSKPKPEILQPLVTTYLEMLAPPAPSRGQRFAGANTTAGGRELLANRPREAGDLVLGKTKKAAVSDQKFKIRELNERNWTFNRDMYFRVGEQWHWIDKRPWRDEQWKEYANDTNVRTFVGYYEDEVAGYFELRRSRNNLQPRTAAATEDEIEIAYFGLLPEFIGRGLGGALLTSAIENAWEWSPSPERVWVHTCNRDHPSALHNYQARGFKVYKVERTAT